MHKMAESGTKRLNLTCKLISQSHALVKVFGGDKYGVYKGQACSHVWNHFSIFQFIDNQAEPVSLSLSELSFRRKKTGKKLQLNETKRCQGF